jgi:hypothetical protein
MSLFLMELGNILLLVHFERSDDLLIRRDRCDS